MPLAEAPPVMYQYNNSYRQPVNNPNFLTNVSQPPLSTSMPVTSQWKCIPCDLVLESKPALERHTASHVTCTECSFQAAPKVVKAHHQARHGKFAGSGFKNVTVAIPGCQVQRFRICVGNRPEDITEWIAERKRRFPRRTPAVNEEKIKEEESGLSTLLAGYGSSDDDASTAAEIPLAAFQEEEQSIATEQLKENTESPKMLRKRPCRYFVRNGTCRNGANCTFLHELPSPVTPNDASRNKPAKRPKQELTLLERLLQNDKKRENALVLQLIDFIVENNFLQSDPC
ncbi:hypothetical protein FisN_4Hu461 [Fistulifera solaris]|uniref:C3H1-type domain-containing protein n=1 Tax=Fistulifera solaris TaxID=1519565 RepID=A0A1Z5KIE8_FISSO|nr:hypothetical protein FisN_4Hu461 [Fistulifera solaris]|eukprot:GAX26039.1 hypothetical protein FisN_4Hu461 [Fistulifera solaris]